MVIIIISNELSLHKYGVTIQRATELGIYGSKRTLTIETPFQFRGGKIDAAEMGAFTYLGNHNSFFRHIGKIGRFSAIASDIQTGHVEHSVEMLTPHPMFIVKFDNNWNAADCLYEDMDFLKQVRDENTKTIKRRSYIEIGNDVWIGHGVYISRGVKIGDGAVIAAKSVVVADVEPYTIVGGIPAKPIRKKFSDEVIDKLLELRWWEYGPEILKGVRIYDMDETVYEIENRITKGIKKYAPDKIEFDLVNNTIYHLSSETGEKKVIKQL